MGKGQKYQEQRDKGEGGKLTGLNVNGTGMEVPRRKDLKGNEMINRNRNSVRQERKMINVKGTCQL